MTVYGSLRWIKDYTTSDNASRKIIEYFDDRAAEAALVASYSGLIVVLYSPACVPVILIHTKGIVCATFWTASLSWKSVANTSPIEKEKDIEVRKVSENLNA